jgi:hypothetical protein
MWFSKKKRAAQEEAEILEDLAFRESDTPEEGELDYEASAVQYDEDRDEYTTHFYTDLTFLKSDEAAFNQLSTEGIGSSHYGPRTEGDRIVIEDLTLTSQNRDALVLVRTRLLALHELRASQKVAADKTAADTTFSELNAYLATK